MWDLGPPDDGRPARRDARFALIIRGAAMGLLFTPINNVGVRQPEAAARRSRRRG